MEDLTKDPTIRFSPEKRSHIPIKRTTNKSNIKSTEPTPPTSKRPPLPAPKKVTETTPSSVQRNESSMRSILPPQQQEPSPSKDSSDQYDDFDDDPKSVNTSQLSISGSLTKRSQPTDKV